MNRFDATNPPQDSPGTYPSDFPDNREEEEIPPSKGILLLTLSLTGAVFLVDALTPQRLVVSILLDVPIALSALTLKKSATALMVILGIAANIIAGIINAHQEGSTDSIAIANRFFSGISLILVGYLAIRIQNGAIRTGRSMANTRRLRRAKRMQKILGEIHAETDPDLLLREMIGHFKTLFRARGILIAHSRLGRWSSPILSLPESLWFWKEGEDLPGAITLFQDESRTGPIRKMSLSPVLDRNHAFEGYHGQITLPSTDRETDSTRVLHLFILDPEEEDTPSILSEVLPMMEEAIHRSEALHDLKNRNEQLLRSNNLLRDLVYGFSHDIRTPLVANALNMNLALDNAWGQIPDKLRPILLQSKHSQESLLELSNSLIFLSRYELNEIPAEREPIALDTLIEDILRELDPLLREKDLKTSLDLLPTIMTGDGQAIKRLLTNIIDNAIKWSPPGGTIFFSLKTEGKQVFITVQDEGPGVSDHVRPVLFKRFGGMHPGGGFGLGVYLADQIARRHGGEIRLLPSETGARFVVELSLGQEET